MEQTLLCDMHTYYLGEVSQLGGGEYMIKT